jgi:hypothetical protein
MSGVRFVADLSFVGELLRSPGVEAAVRDAGQRVLSAAQSGAPVKSGDYQSSLRLDVEEHRSRVVAHVWSGDPAGNLIERRTGNLRRALGSA